MQREIAQQKRRKTLKETIESRDPQAPRKFQELKDLGRKCILKKGMRFSSRETLELSIRECFNYKGLIPLLRTKSTTELVFGIMGMEDQKILCVKCGVRKGKWVVNLVKFPKPSQNLNALRLTRSCPYRAKDLAPIIVEIVKIRKELRLLHFEEY